MTATQTEAKTTQRQLWDRQPGESSAIFAAFCRYRDLGPHRLIRDAVIAWLAERPPRCRQQKRYRQLLEVDGAVERYVEGVRHRWKEWSRLWGWRRRVRAFDEKVEEDARQDVIVEHVEEETRQLRLRLEEARELRASARRGLAVAVPVALARIEKASAAVAELQERGAPDAEIAKAARKGSDDAVAVLSWVVKAMVEGQKLERLELGEVTARTAIHLDPASIDKLADIITAHVPEDRWESVVEEVVATLKGDHVNGHP